VDFYDGTTNLGAGALDSSGTATFGVATLSTSGSPHSITAVYGGDNTFAGSDSSVLSQIITNAVATGATVTIALVNPGFESPAGAQGTVAGAPVGWVASNHDPYGVYNPAPGDYAGVVNDILPAPAQGSQVLWINEGNYVAQFLTNSLAANQTYTLSGAIGNRANGYGMLATDQEYVDLVAGNTITAQNTNLTHPEPGRRRDFRPARCRFGSARRAPARSTTTTSRSQLAPPARARPRRFPAQHRSPRHRIPRRPAAWLLLPPL
jgi:hypothetical protein